MKFEKYKLSLLARIRCVIGGIKNLADPYIWVCGEDIIPHYERHPWRDRFSILASEVETALLGYLYHIPKEEE